MIETLISRFQRRRPETDAQVLRHAWANEDSNWHGSSLDLARGLDVTEVALGSPGDRPRTASVFLDSLAAVHGARR